MRVRMRVSVRLCSCACVHACMLHARMQHFFWELFAMWTLGTLSPLVDGVVLMAGRESSKSAFTELDAKTIESKFAKKKSLNAGHKSWHHRNSEGCESCDGRFWCENEAENTAELL